MHVLEDCVAGTSAQGHEAALTVIRAPTNAGGRPPPPRTPSRCWNAALGISGRRGLCQDASAPSPAAYAL